MFAFINESKCDISDVTDANVGMTKNAQITNLGHERPIYYDTIGKMQLIHDEWVLLTYYNLTTYWQAVLDIENYLEDVRILCQKMDPRYCENTVQQLFHDMELIKYYNNILLAPHKHLSDPNSLFGILDQHFAEKYHQDIKAIQNNERYLLELVKNQTTIVELENEIMIKNKKNIRQQFVLMNKFMNDTGIRLTELQSEIGTVMVTNYFSSHSTLAAN
ncbi:Envelope fusion protein [Operophtera brumata]|uniref:Envelope fusion protein n=1 Tax=Operophtera brumata TaxID=104452 RepID=A0A0L7LB99_OPEBR|nr:Envelope fusion protein [Operophtera brumata]